MNTARRIALIFVFTVLASGISVVSPWAQQGGVVLGKMVCKTLPGTRVRVFLSSSVAIECVFESKAGKEEYKGELGFLGIDLSRKSSETLNFTVVGLTANVKIGSHSLAGDYIGATVSAGIYKKGYGSTQFVGGISKSFSLVPSIDTFEGTGISAGTSRMKLKAK